MTTVDFNASRLDKTAEQIHLGNGLSGPATAALFRLVDLVKSGEVEGQEGPGRARAQLTGRQLRELLRGLGDDAGVGWVERRGHTDEASLQAAIVDEGIYSVSAFDF